MAVEELAGGSATPIQTVRLSGAGAALPYATRWQCDRRRRSFRATTPGPGSAAEIATAEIETPDCADRLRVTLEPARPRAGRTVAVTVVDRWREGGFPLSLCRSEPRGCTELATPVGGEPVATRVRLRRAGRFAIEVRAPFGRTRRTGRARPRGRLRVLATGDSMIQVVDGFLARKLGRRAGVHSDARISTGISKPFLLDWGLLAARQARRLRSDATVVFLGANDGFGMRTPAGVTAACCGEAWVAEYARRARRMMALYARGGAARVYWLTLPAPRSGAFRRVYGPVNEALVRAARGLPDVRLVRLDRVFTPGFRFRTTIRYRGRRVNARQRDGVHLSNAGAAVAADLIARALRADGLLG